MTRLRDSEPVIAEAGAQLLKVFSNDELVPQEWRAKPPEVGARTMFRVFNPTITAVGDGYAMVYRVVDETHEFRRLASCALTSTFDVVKGTVEPLSDLIDFVDRDALDERACQWHADPRFAACGGDTYLTWNDGGNKPVNHQFIMRMSACGRRPAEPARELTRELTRASIEKNWMLFESGNNLYAVYSIHPHEVLRVDLTDPRAAICRPAHQAVWNNSYSSIYGVLRGSAAPVPDGDGFIAIAHSSYQSPEGRRYAACFYRFEGQPPFRVTHAPTRPCELPNPHGVNFVLPKLNANVCEVIYPCGFIKEDECAIVSYGLNDEACAIARLSLEDIGAIVEPAVTELTLSSAPTTAFDSAVQPSAPRPLRSVKAAAVPLFWWDAAGSKIDGAGGVRRFSRGNFGDIASPEIVGRITGLRTRGPRAHDRKLLSTGSVLHKARNGDVVWGSGSKSAPAKLDDGVRELSVHAVRGPLTLDYLRQSRVDLSNVKELFDPGCLVPRLYAGEIQRLTAEPKAGATRYRVVPHFKDDLLLRRREYKHLNAFVSVDATPAEFIASIHGAERVISSSLHGLIFAEALGIPACWLAPLGGEDEKKYYDYYFGTSRWRVKRFESIDEALRAEPMPLPLFRFDDYLATFPHSEVAELSTRGLNLGERVDMSSIAPDELDDLMGLWNFELKGRKGIWATANKSRIQMHVNQCRNVSGLLLEAVFRPFNPEQLKVPQRIELTLNGEKSVAAEWARGSSEPVKLSLPIAHDGAQSRFFDLTIAARNARSPRSFGLSGGEERLAACLESIVVRQSGETNVSSWSGDAGDAQHSNGT